MSISKPQSVIIHPLVLLSVVDHYSRVLNKTNSQRVIGVLLGEKNSQGVVDILNSYAIPFEEDSKNNDVWFLDHLYHETMFQMFKKINIKEKVVGWYSTGNNIRHNDILINNLMKNYTQYPVFVLIDTQQSNKLSIPTEAYFSQEEVDANGTIRNIFINIKSSVQALEPEEIGVEQLLREIHEENEGILTSLVNQKTVGLQGMVQKINEIVEYLDSCLKNGKVVKNEIGQVLQEIMNGIHTIDQKKLNGALTSQNNDGLLSIYIGQLSSTLIHLHSLINNRLQNEKSN